MESEFGEGSMKNKLLNKKGFTFIETMIGSVFVTMFFVILTNIYGSSMTSITHAQEIRLATTEAQNVLEKIKSTSFEFISVFFHIEFV